MMDPVKLGVRLASWTRGMIWATAVFVTGWIVTEAFARGVGWAYGLTLGVGLAIGELYYSSRIRVVRSQIEEINRLWADHGRK